MQSFYGGKPGFSFIIVKSFSSVAEMVSCFQQGPTYSAVHYDEHVLINTENKNDPDNGKVYRRGYDYTNAMGGAVYVGTIVGPAGRAPMLELTTIETVRLKQETEGVDKRYTEGEYSVPVSMVPGKNGTTYNDTVEWACCCVRSANGEDSIAYIGFKFPYLVVDLTAEGVDPYYHRSDDTADFINEDLIVRTDGKDHPFYEQWHISVPKGISGDTFKNLRIIDPTDSNVEIYKDATGTERADDIEGRNDDATKPRQILVYDYYNYEKDPNGEPVTLYLGDYNMIKKITFDEEGSIRVEYTHDDDLYYDKLIKWVDEVQLTREGHFTVWFNQTDDTIEDEDKRTKYEQDISWVDNITVADNGTITLRWCTGESEDILTNHLRWIDDIEVHADGTVVVNYNDGTNDTFINCIRWITNVRLEQNGKFTVNYNNGTPPYITTLTWVEDIQVDADGTVHIIYNNGDPTEYNQMIKYIDHIYFKDDDTDPTKNNKFHVVYNTGEDEIIDNVIKFIDHIYIDDDPDTPGDFLFHVVYNTGDDVAVGRDPINYIEATVIHPDTYHFLVYYTNPNIRGLIPADKKVSYDGKDDWLDLGSIKDDAGILVGLNIVPPTGSTIGTNVTAAIAHLNTTYPTGLINPMVKGKIITIGEDGDNKKFYAFDYNANSWYYLGTFDNTVNWIMVAKADDPTLATQKQKIATGGVWFIVEGEDDV